MARKRAEQVEAEQQSVEGAPQIAREPGDEQQQEREYPPEPNPRDWEKNNLAGVQFLTRREPYEAAIAFKDKPSQPVLDTLKENGFRWNKDEKVWTRPVGYASQAQDRLIASRTYSKVVSMILEEKGLADQVESEKTPF